MKARNTTQRRSLDLRRRRQTQNAGNKHGRAEQAHRRRRERGLRQAVHRSFWKGGSVIDMPWLSQSFCGHSWPVPRQSGGKRPWANALRQEKTSAASYPFRGRIRSTICRPSTPAPLPRWTTNLGYRLLRQTQQEPLVSLRLWPDLTKFRFTANFGGAVRGTVTQAHGASTTGGGRERQRGRYQLGYYWDGDEIVLLFTSVTRMRRKRRSVKELKGFRARIDFPAGAKKGRHHPGARFRSEVLGQGQGQPTTKDVVAGCWDSGTVKGHGGRKLGQSSALRHLHGELNSCRVA